MSNSISRLYIGSSKWSPEAKKNSFAGLTVDMGVYYARRWPIGLGPVDRPGVISVFDVLPGARVKRIARIEDRPSRVKGLDLICDDSTCIVIDPSVLKYAGFNLVSESDGKVLGERSIERCLRGVTRKMLSEMPAQSTAWDINNGSCEEWARDALEALGGDPLRGIGGDMYWFDSFSNDMMKAEGLPGSDEDGISHIAHMVLSYAGRWYDAQHPRGVDTLSSLDIVKKVSRKEWLGR